MSPRMSYWRAKPTALVSINQCALPIHPQLDLGLHVGSVDKGHLSKKLVDRAWRTGRSRDQGTHSDTPHPESTVPCGHCVDSTKSSKGWGAHIRMWGLAPLRPPPLLRGIWGWMVPGQMPQSLAPVLPPTPGSPEA